MLIPPRKIHRFVTELCGRIVPGGAPVRVPVVVDPRAIVNECFFNVANRIKEQGGGIQHGWCIWENPGLFIEGEFHGVWIGPDGKFIDITPKADGETEILFLPDRKEVFDEAAFNRRDNRRIAILRHRSVYEFIKVSEELHHYKMSCRSEEDPRVFKVNEQKYLEFEMRKTLLDEEMRSVTPGRNDPCRCGSGDKFKKCCGR